VSGLGCELWRWKLGGTCEVRQILFLPLGIFDSYVSLIQKKKILVPYAEYRIWPILLSHPGPLAVS
jgi:hypothetical protein